MLWVKDSFAWTEVVTKLALNGFLNSRSRPLWNQCCNCKHNVFDWLLQLQKDGVVFETLVVSPRCLDVQVYTTCCRDALYASTR